MTHQTVLDKRYKKKQESATKLCTGLYRLFRRTHMPSKLKMKTLANTFGFMLVKNYI